MNDREEFGKRGWNGGRRRRDQRDDSGVFAGGDPLDLAIQAGLWSSGCLAAASAMPPVLVAPLLRELLLFCAFAVSIMALLRGERLNLSHFNRQDVALFLLALGLIAGLFVDHAAVQEYVGAAAAETAAEPAA